MNDCAWKIEKAEVLADSPTGEKEFLKEDEIRVKVGNFALTAELILNIGDYLAPDESWAPSKRLKAGPIGGSAHFYSRDRLERLGAFDFKSAPASGPADVKFSIRRSTIRRLMDIFSVTRSKTFEYDIYRELQEELAFESFPERREIPVLTQAETNRIRAQYRWVTIYETKREEDDGFNVSISRFFTLKIPAKIRKNLWKAENVIFVPTSREMRSGEMKRDGAIVEISRKALVFDQLKKGRLSDFSKLAALWTGRSDR